MSETLTSLEQPLSPEHQALQESELRFSERVDQLSQLIPELKEKPEIAEVGKELINEFGLTPDLFESEGRSLVFAGISARAANLKNLHGDAQQAEKLFVNDTVALLAHKYSDKLTEASQIIKAESETLDDDTRQRVYDKYTDKELSKEVRQIIEAGFLDHVKDKLGVTTDNEDPYEVRVLTIADDAQLHGIDAPTPDYSLPYGHPDFEDADLLRDDVQKWKEGLKSRNAEFAKELGMNGATSPAWITEVNGKKLLCISNALAEKIRDPSIIENTDWYSENDLSADFAMLAHEYTHTQGGIMVDGETTFGINLEELRAEHFSGDRQGYQDIKGFFQAYAIITGHNIKGELDMRIKGGNTVESFGAVANTVGLSKMLEVMLASPNNYINDQSNSFIREAYNYIDGFDGVLRSLYDQQVMNGNQQVIDDRITHNAEVLNEIDMDLELFESYRAGLGLKFMTEKLVGRARELKDSKN